MKACNPLSTVKPPLLCDKIPLNILPNLKQIASTTQTATTTPANVTSIPQTIAAALSEPSITTNGNTMQSGYLQMSSFPVVAVAPAVAQVLPSKIVLPKAINTAPTKVHQPIPPQSLQYAIAPLNSTPTLQVFNSPVSLIPAAVATSGKEIQLLTLSNKPNILNTMQNVIPTQLPSNKVTTPIVSMAAVTMPCTRTSGSTESTQQKLVPPSSGTSVLPSMPETLSTTVPSNIHSLPIPQTNTPIVSSFVSSVKPSFPNNSGTVQPTAVVSQLPAQVIPTGSISMTTTSISSVQSYTSSQVSTAVVNVSSSLNSLVDTMETSSGRTPSTISSREQEAIKQQNYVVGNPSLDIPVTQALTNSWNILNNVHTVGNMSSNQSNVYSTSFLSNPDPNLMFTTSSTQSSTSNQQPLENISPGTLTTEQQQFLQFLASESNLISGQSPGQLQRLLSAVGEQDSSDSSAWQNEGFMENTTQGKSSEEVIYSNCLSAKAKGAGSGYGLGIDIEELFATSGGELNL